MPLGTNQITKTSHAIFVPQLWANEAIVQREAAKIMANLVKNIDNEVAGKGDTINLQTISNLSANAKAVNTQVTLQANSETNSPMLVNKFYEASFLVEIVLAAQTAINIQKEYTPKAVEAVERQKDTNLTSLYAAITQIVGGSTPLTEAAFVAGLVFLDNANAPQINRHLAIRPKGKADLLQINKFTGVTIGQNATSPGTVKTMNIVENGLFGELYGVEVNVTTQIQTVTGVNQNLLFQEEAFALAEQIPTTTHQAMIDEYLGYLTTAYGLWGAMNYRLDHSVNFQSN